MSKWIGVLITLLVGAVLALLANYMSNYNPTKPRLVGYKRLIVLDKFLSTNALFLHYLAKETLAFKYEETAASDLLRVSKSIGMVEPSLGDKVRFYTFRVANETGFRITGIEVINNSDVNVLISENRKPFVNFLNPKSVRKIEYLNPNSSFSVFMVSPVYGNSDQEISILSGSELVPFVVSPQSDKSSETPWFISIIFLILIGFSTFGYVFSKHDKKGRITSIFMTKDEYKRYKNVIKLYESRK